MVQNIANFDKYTTEFRLAWLQLRRDQKLVKQGTKVFTVIKKNSSSREALEERVNKGGGSPI